MSNTKETRVAEQTSFHFFYGGPFSQWRLAPFKAEGIEFNCAEQWMMWHKARLFGDDKAASAVLASDSPSEQKRIGRRVIGYTDKLWHPVAKPVVFAGSVYKFTQNWQLGERLKATRGQLLVEASPTDRVWGIGLDEWDEDRFDPSKWRGTNWLGEILTAVRIALYES
jgi:ribA/ribD-fused uncharacterized protein